jgi:hypothetical protein
MNRSIWGSLCSRGMDAEICATAETIASVSVMKEYRADIAADEHNLSTAIRRGGNKASIVRVVLVRSTVCWCRWWRGVSRC